MDRPTIKLTGDDLDRIRDVIAINIDLNIQPELDKAMAAKQEDRAKMFMESKERDQAILNKFYHTSDRQKIKLNTDDLDRIRDILAANIDLNIQPKLNKAMQNRNESLVRTLMETKERDKAILAKFYDPGILMGGNVK